MGGSLENISCRANRVDNWIHDEPQSRACEPNEISLANRYSKVSCAAVQRAERNIPCELVFEAGWMFSFTSSFGLEWWVWNGVRCRGRHQLTPLRQFTKRIGATERRMSFSSVGLLEGLRYSAQLGSPPRAARELTSECAQKEGRMPRQTQPDRGWRSQTMALHAIGRVL
jgi:hypothetical protein